MMPWCSSSRFTHMYTGKLDDDDDDDNGGVVHLISVEKYKLAYR